ncbi:MAG: glycerol-3-phosphate dehydrogenase C-terminal domain-containing protein [Ostreibacterium sp.]
MRVDGDENQAAVINIFGGKITTYRKLSESVLEKIEEKIGPKGAPWTAGSTLPGGDFLPNEFEQVVVNLQNDYSFLTGWHAARLVRSYGTLAWSVLGDAKSYKDLGEDFGHTLTEREVNYLVAHEWASSENDILWRRSKLGIRFSKQQVNKLEDWFKNKNKNGNFQSEKKLKNA